MPEQEHGFVLAVGIPDIQCLESDGLTSAANARQAIELLRMLRFDLVVTADTLPDMPVWQFIQRMHAAWPWQKWALVSDSLSHCDEIAARSLGVTSIIEGAFDLEGVHQLAGTLRAQAESTQKSMVRSGPNVLRPAAAG